VRKNLNFRQIYNLHPVLFGIFPILSLFSINIGEVSDDEMFEFYLIVIVIGVSAFLIWKGLSWILKNKEKAALLVSFSWIMVLLYGHARTVLEEFVPREIYFLALWLAIFAIGIIGILKIRKEIHNVPLILFAISATLIIFPLGEIIVYSLEGPSFVATYLDEIKVVSEPTISYKPDIYYIILDAYGSQDTLDNYYNFDNEEFLNFLEENDFYITTESKANYQNTHHSLSSSLNMIYINFVLDKESIRPGVDLSAELIEYCGICKFLKSQGYQHIHFGSSWKNTKWNQNADVNINYFRNRAADFTIMFYETTLVYPLLLKSALVLGIEGRAPDPKNEFFLENYERILFQFEELKKIPDIEEPTFTFVHLIIPHDPFVFKEDGSYLSQEEAEKIPFKEKYLLQVKVINKKIMEAVENILENSTDPPIIIVQGDHGPQKFWIDRKLKEGIHWNISTIEESQARFGILNVYYLPGEKDFLYPSVSPVNSFRLIFNNYFGTDLEIFPDYSYDITRKSGFVNMTDKVNKKIVWDENPEDDIEDKFDWKKMKLENPTAEKFSYIYELLKIYSQRDDLQVAFPQVEEGEFQELMSWAGKYGVGKYPTISKFEPIYALMDVYHNHEDLKTKFPEASNGLDLQNLFCWADSNIDKLKLNAYTVLIPHKSFYERNCLSSESQ